MDISPERPPRNESSDEEAAASERRFREFALHILQVQTQERSRISRVLHDDVAQLLTAAGLQLDILRVDLEEAVPGIASRTTAIQTALESVLQRVRELSYELSQDWVERIGLRSALDRLVGRSRPLFNGTIRFQYDSSASVPVETGAAMYFIAGHAVENAIRHSGGEQIEVNFKKTRQGPALEISDNGHGFDHPAVRTNPPGLGLLLMDSCASKANLALEISTATSKGTVVRATSSHALREFQIPPRTKAPARNH
jgi:signal transduction histidine kinase